MFLSFKPNRSQKQPIKNEAQDRVANSIVQKCIQVQEQCATFMQQKTEKLSYRVKKLLLVLFLLFSGGYSLYLIYESFKNHKSRAFSIAPIKTPKYTTPSVDENTKATVIMCKAEYDKMHHFKLYMDSLAKSAPGKRLYDSILARHHGLLESLQIIEKLYQLQTSKK